MSPACHLTRACVVGVPSVLKPWVRNLVERGVVKWQLVEALQHFPAIHNMRYGNESPSGRDFGRAVPSWDSLSPVARKILAEPESHPRYMRSEEQFWALLEALCETGHSVHLGGVHGKQLDLKRWNETAPALECHKQLPALHDLSLEFAFAQHGQDEITQLSDMITHAPSLRTLRLSFDISLSTIRER